MILDDIARKGLVDEWQTLRCSQGKVEIHYTASCAMGGFMLSSIVDNIYALFLPFGFSVLEHALQQIRDEGKFTCRSSQLKALMEASKNIVSWRDYDTIYDARDIRNQLTHEQVVPKSKDTFQILDKIEQELIQWGILGSTSKI